MALYKATQVRNGVPVPSANGATDVIPVVGDFTVPTGGLAIGDIVECGAIPAGYVPVDLIVDNGAFAASVTANFGILSGNYGDGTHGAATARTCGAEFAAAQAMTTAGIKRAAAAGACRIAPTTNDRSFGFVTAGAAGSAGAVVRVTMLCRPQSEGV
jgi:hypothetical protein